MDEKNTAFANLGEQFRYNAEQARANQTEAKYKNLLSECEKASHKGATKLNVYAHEAPEDIIVKMKKDHQIEAKKFTAHDMPFHGGECCNSNYPCTDYIQFNWGEAPPSLDGKK